MRFIDKVRIYAKGGSGGNGCLSFLREKYREFGGPDGGDGGKGGDVVLRADSNVGTLLDFSYRPHLKAAPGGNGKGANKTGPAAPDLVLRVPVGTVIYRDGRLQADLSSPGASACVARGGRGGRGNASFKSRRNTAPRIYEKGEPGEEVTADLELKLIADVGLAGFPNAGKSTLLSRLSNARPKIADYPFTTLAPHLGLVRHKETGFVMADIPGLIEGAHRGKGLGDAFLRHVERTRILLHMIDPLGFDGVPAEKGVSKIYEELKSHSRVLAAKPRILVVSKADLPEAERVYKRVRARFRRRKVFLVSSATGKGVEELLDCVLSELSKHPRDPVSFAPERSPKTVKVESGFRVERLAGSRFRVTGVYVERVASMTDLNLLESVYRLQTTFHKIGVDKALRSKGVREGDIVFVGPLELEWSDVPMKAPPKLTGKRKR